MINRMFRRSDSSTSIRSSSTDPPEIPVEDGTINSESYQLSDLDQKLGDWNIPKVPTNQVYRSSSWQSKISFRTDYHVRTIEQVYSINKEYETCYLLSPAAMMAHRKDGQKFLHIGLVQVGVKPLIREGLNIPTMAPGIMVILSSLMKILWLSPHVGQTTTTMSSEMSPVNYGRITTL